MIVDIEKLRAGVASVKTKYPGLPETKHVSEVRDEPHRGPCAHRGDPLTGGEIHRLGLPVRDWHQCDAEPSYGVVCPCQGCGPACKGYQRPEE